MPPLRLASPNANGAASQSHLPKEFLLVHDASLLVTARNHVSKPIGSEQEADTRHTASRRRRPMPLPTDTYAVAIAPRFDWKSGVDMRIGGRMLVR